MSDRRDMARVWLEVGLDKVRNNFRKIRDAAALEEALVLKTFGKPVMILGGVLDSELSEAVANDIIPGGITSDGTINHRRIIS